MRVAKFLSIACLGGGAFVSPVVADPNSFTGLGIGLSLGMCSYSENIETLEKNKLAIEGQQVGLGIGYGLDLSGAYLGARFGYDMCFLPDTGFLKNKNSFKFDIHLGMAIENVALPTLFIGYGMNKAEINTGDPLAGSEAATYSKANFGGLRYGARFDIKVAPQMTVGLGTAWWGGKKTIDEVAYKTFSNETTLSFGYHL